MHQVSCLNALAVNTWLIDLVYLLILEWLRHNHCMMIGFLNHRPPRVCFRHCAYGWFWPAMTLLPVWATVSHTDQYLLSSLSVTTYRYMYISPNNIPFTLPIIPIFCSITFYLFALYTHTHTSMTSHTLVCICSVTAGGVADLSAPGVQPSAGPVHWRLWLHAGHGRDGQGSQTWTSGEYLSGGW